jgi:lysophospholipase L1-like esterase
MAGTNDASLRKGLPKRARNAAKKAKRQRCWAAAQKRKAANIAANKAAFEANEVYRRQGLPTPYQLRKKARAKRSR